MHSQIGRQCQLPIAHRDYCTLRRRLLTQSICTVAHYPDTRHDTRDERGREGERERENEDQVLATGAVKERAAAANGHATCLDDKRAYCIVYVRS